MEGGDVEDLHRWQVMWRWQVVEGGDVEVAGDHLADLVTQVPQPPLVSQSLHLHNQVSGVR